MWCSQVHNNRLLPNFVNGSQKYLFITALVSGVCLDDQSLITIRSHMFKKVRCQVAIWTFRDGIKIAFVHGFCWKCWCCSPKRWVNSSASEVPTLTEHRCRHHANTTDDTVNTRRLLWILVIFVLKNQCKVQTSLCWCTLVGQARRRKGEGTPVQ